MARHIACLTFDFEFIRTPDRVLRMPGNGGNLLRNWIDDFLRMRDNLERGVITYTFHPFVIGRSHRMPVLEKLLHVLERNGAAVFTRPEDAVGDYRARNAAANAGAP